MARHQGRAADLHPEQERDRDKAVERIKAHANFKRRGVYNDEDRLDFVLHANGDTDRETRLTFLPFALPNDATSRFAR